MCGCVMRRTVCQTTWQGLALRQASVGGMCSGSDRLVLLIRVPKPGEKPWSGWSLLVLEDCGCFLFLSWLSWLAQMTHLCYECGMNSLPAAARTGLGAWLLPRVTAELGTSGLLCSDPSLSFHASSLCLCSTYSWLCYCCAEQGPSECMFRGDCFLQDTLAISGVPAYLRLDNSPEGPQNPLEQWLSTCGS